MSRSVMSIQKTDKVVLHEGKAVPIVLFGEKDNKREYLLLDSENASMIPFIGPDAKEYVHGNKYAIAKDDILWPSLQQSKCISVTSEAYTKFVKDNEAKTK